jgi:hypothetical protein
LEDLVDGVSPVVLQTNYQILVNAWKMLMMLAEVAVLLAVNAEYLQDLTLKEVALVVLSKVCVELLKDWTVEAHLVLVALVGELLLHDHLRLMRLIRQEN